jgi:hypothetical protein
VSECPSDEQVRAEAAAVEAGARLLYTAYRSHRNFVEGDRLPDWEHLCERKRDRFRSVARAARTFLKLPVGDPSAVIA